MNESIAFHPTNSDVVDFMVNTISSSKEDKVLDTGFGKGAFLDGLKRMGFSDISGIELDTEFYNESAENYDGMNLIKGDYLSYDGEYDTIIGNPPYIKCSKLDRVMQNVLFDLTKTKTSDIYYGFIIKSIMNLKDGGELIYILPSSFFTNKYASHLRSFMMENGDFEYIINLGELKVFSTANVETIIFKYVKNKRIDKISVYNVKKKGDSDYIKKLNDSFSTETSNDLFDYYKIDQFSDDKWNISKTFYDFDGELLSKYVDIGVGIVSGCDSVFTITNEDDNFNDTEKDIFVKYFLKGKNLKPYVSTDDLVKMIFIPQKFDTEEKLKQYPNLYNYIESNKEKLEDRYFSSKNKPYFSYLAIRNMDAIENNKNKEVIAVPTITRKKSKWFSLSKNKNRYISSDILYLSEKVDDSLYFVLGVLNSDFFAEYYNNIGVKKGERFLFTQGFLCDIMIPIFDDLDKKKISDTTKYIVDNINDLDVQESIDKIDSIIKKYI